MQNVEKHSSSTGRVMVLLGAWCVAVLFASAGVASGATVSGELKQWHRVEVDFQGPQHYESDQNPNPFLDYRLTCRFTSPSGTRYDVPGFFNTDGNGGSSGRKWTCRIAPDETGNWSYSADFVQGDKVAIEFSGGNHTSFDGESGNFSVSASDKSGRDFRSPEKGTLTNAGAHYLQFRGSGKAWLKGGANMPENFLGYEGFDNTPDAGHDFSTQRQDWESGDPDWGGGDGRGIIGSLNYLASTGANSIYFLPMNVNGDGDDTFPTISESNKTNYDTSKLAQWEIVFTHADKLGIFLHFVLSESESGNANYHDGGNLGKERKLFYRELIARFGHHLGVQWNIGEENEYGTSKRRQFAEYLKDVDPYDHPVTTHTTPSHEEEFFRPLLGNRDFDTTSFQVGVNSVVELIPDWRERSAEAGAPWVVCIDEPLSLEANGSNQVYGYPGTRKRFIWPMYMSGAGGLELYFQEDGGGHSLDQEMDSFREIAKPLEWLGYALDFMSEVPLLQMSPRRDLSNATATLAWPGRYYAIYDADGDTIDVDLRDASGSDTFVLRWFHPRDGEWNDGGTVEGGDTRTLQGRPFGGDFAALLVHEDDFGSVVGGCVSNSECNDDNPCTRDRCNAERVCTNKPRNEGQACGPTGTCVATVGTCTDGVCTGTEMVQCDDGDVCNGIETCDEDAGGCVTENAPNCSDGNPCTRDQCDPETGCHNPPRSDGRNCDDGLACTHADECLDGVCVGVDVCGDGGRCDTGSGQCVVEGAGITIDEASSVSECEDLESLKLSFSVTVREHHNKVLVIGAGCEDQTAELCDFRDIAHAKFGSRALNLAAVRNSDENAWMTSAAMFYLLDQELEIECDNDFPCTRTVSIKMGPDASHAPNNLHGGAFVLFGVSQEPPHVTKTDGGDECEGGLDTSIRTEVPNSWVVNVASVGNAGSFEHPGDGQEVRWSEGSCESSASQSTTKIVPTPDRTRVTAIHPNVNRCAHVLAAFAPAAVTVGPDCSEICSECLPGDCNDNGEIDAGDLVCAALCNLGVEGPEARCDCAAWCDCLPGLDNSDVDCALDKLLNPDIPGPCD